MHYEILDWIVLLAGASYEGVKSGKVKLKTKEQKSSTFKDNVYKNNLQ